MLYGDSARGDALTQVTRTLFSAAAFAICSFAQAQPTAPQLREIVVKPSPQDDVAPRTPGGIGIVHTLDLDAGPVTINRLDQLLVESGLAAWDASNSLGIADGFNIRGFSVSNQGSAQLQASRVFLNGHADIAWRFARDPATVSRVELISGHDSTLLGAGSPAGSLHYTTKSPEGHEFQRMGLSLGSNGGKRVVGDAELHVGPLQTRGVIAVQRGERGVERVDDDRNVLLLANRLPIGQGELRLDVEYHQRKQPFVFGTAYAGGQFWFDQPYVDPRASANRQYHRQALYLTHPLTADTRVTAHWQHARSTRNETLIGFFDVLNASELRGYYRTIDETNGQSDAGLKLEGRYTLGATRHDWTVAWQHLGLRRNFAGPQNIGGFTLVLANPVFPADLSALALAPRFAFDRYRERGLGLADAITHGPWDVRVGMRRASLQLDSSTNPAVPLARVADSAHTSAAIAAGLRLNEQQRVWLSRTESFLPNRGRFSGGAFLPPSEGLQWEAGWQYKATNQVVSLALFDLKQSNLPGRDPADPDALVLVGTNRARGAEFQANFNAAGLAWNGALTLLRARIANPVNPTQGGYLAGTPDGYGALGVRGKLAPSVEASAILQAARSRPGDGKPSFRAPGYAVVNLGVVANAGSRIRWGIELLNAFDRRYVRALTGADNVWQGSRREARLWFEASLNSH